jgi:hypothetical protein
MASVVAETRRAEKLICDFNIHNIVHMKLVLMYSVTEYDARYL